jgi:hypothetical protein
MPCRWVIAGFWASAAVSIGRHQVSWAHVQWGDVATWAQSVGVAGALFAALYQIHTERMRRHADEEAERLRQRRQQAERVSGWPGQGAWPTTPLILLNLSDEPVYEVVASLVMIQGGGPRRGEDGVQPEFRRVIGILPPGRFRVEVAGGWPGMSRRPGVEVAFTDRSGVHWIRRATGTLDEITAPAIDHYGLGRPQELVIPDEVPPSAGSYDAPGRQAASTPQSVAGQPEARKTTARRAIGLKSEAARSMALSRLRRRGRAGRASQG